MSLAIENKPLSNMQIYFLIGILFFSVVPHFFNFPWFISLFFVVSLIFRITFISTTKKPLPKWILFISIILAFVTVAIPGNAIGTGFGVSLLIVMLALKTLELRTIRDAYVFLFLNTFLLITLFLYNQEIYLWFYVWLIIFLILGFIYSLNNQLKSDNISFAGKSVLKIGLQSLPLLIIFFIVFPRLSGPLWAFKHETRSAVTGISDTVTPGSISQLSQSSDIAFRVKFSDNAQLPATQQRYWRGPVLAETDGYVWRKDNLTINSAPTLSNSDEIISYQLIMEPNNQNWIFALEHPVSFSSDLSLSSSFSLQHKEKITKRQTFEISSLVTNILEEENLYQINQSLFVPDIVTPRLENLVDTLNENSQSKDAYIKQVLNFFNQNEFVYTLSPPLMETNPIDEFLFDYRQGFCEHYATSFVILMRMADIPARLVVGYQGGEWNPTGEHLIVRQSDAHAWAEVWLDNIGWRRIDPTSAVAPERILTSINNAPGSEGAPVTFTLTDQSFLTDFIQQAGWMVDTLNLNWHRWIVRFSDKKQKQLFDFAGLSGFTQYTIIILSVFICLIITGLLIWFLRFKSFSSTDKSKIYWHKFLDKLILKSVQVSALLGPVQISQIARDALPDKKSDIENIVNLYIKIRYQKITDKNDLDTFKQCVKRF